jgi:FKBP-type peptidyl-prolyl cis-trans isomerase (trigger factor)
MRAHIFMKKYSVTTTRNNDSTVTITGTLPWNAFMEFEAAALKRLGEHLDIAGFRKGHIPEDIAKKNIGDELLLADMAELALQEFYPTILADEKIDAIGRPQLSITKLARNNELGFSIQTAVLPEIKLPDYTKIAAGVPAVVAEPVTDEDIQKVIENLRQMRAYGHVHPEGDHGHQHTEPLPEVNDEFAQSFGSFKTVEELKTKIRENTGKEKEFAAADKRRTAILEAILEKITVPIPDIILKSEQEKLFSQIEMDISRAGLSMEEYLKHSNKTKEQILEDFKPEAEKRAKMQLMVNAIAKQEKIAPTDEEVQARVETMSKTYPDVDKARMAAYADMVITNEKVIDFLEQAK